MTKFRNKWLIIIVIYLIPLFLDHVDNTDELVWLIYIFPSVWLPFYFGLRGGLLAAFTGILIHGTNEIYEIGFKHEIYQMNEIWCMMVITLVNITVALTIGRLVDKLRMEQDSLEKVVSKMEYMAYHDYLTGLPNRWNFEMKLKAFLEEAKRTNTLLAVLFLDLDRFKLINDSLGHSIGDRLLKDVSKRIQLTLREGDCIARQGGDEFILFFSVLSSKNEVEQIVASLHKSIQAPFKIYDKEYFISSSIGISLFPANGLGREELIQQADIAMYTAKEMGGNGFQWYNSAQQQEIHDVVMIETHLRKALQQKEFKLHYQPLVNLTNGKFFGFEALIRWHNSELGVIPPADFIPLAEEIGMIIPLGEWVLKEACSKMKTLSKFVKKILKLR